MSIHPSPSPRTGLKVAIAVALALAAAGVAAWWVWPKSAPPTVARIDTTGLPEPLRQRVESGEVKLLPQDLSQKETDKLIADAHQHMRQRLREYARMTPEEKKKYLDDQIDQQEKLRAAGGLPLTPSTQPAGPDVRAEASADGTQRRVMIRRGPGDEKSMMESMDPELRALMAQFTSDLRQRRAERGLPDAPGVVMIRRETITR